MNQNDNLYTIPNQDNKKILIIGLGEIGYSNAEYMTSIGLKVDGFDISEKAVARAISAGLIQKKAESFSGYDYYIICISTHLPADMFIPYLDGVYDIAKRLAVEGTPGALVGIDSTIPRGTANKILEILDHRLHVAHVPHRYYVNEKEEHGVRQMRVLGACDKCCEKKAVNFYNGILGIPVHIVQSIQIAELCKTVENAYRFLEIAFAEEMKMVCDNIGINFDDLREAINTKWNTKIHKALEGIGGHCLPKDSQMVLEMNRKFIKSSLLEAAQKVDLQYRSHIGKPIPLFENLLEAATRKTEGENGNKDTLLHISSDVMAPLQKKFNMTEVELESFLAALSNKIITENSEKMKSVVSSKPRTKEFTDTRQHLSA
jgi:UDP-N-acetyl-D-mannosaminuronic acid dehydrogenase